MQAQSSKPKKPLPQPNLLIEDSEEDVEEEEMSVEDDVAVEPEDALAEEEDSKSELEEMQDVQAPVRHISYLALDKPVKDRTIGHITYRVNQPQSRILAPKASKDSRNRKEIFLHARGPKPGVNRGQVKKGFF